MTWRSVAHIFTAPLMEMGKTEVRQALPTAKIQHISPFLLLHHFGPFETMPGEDPLDVAPHPHRGFEPVTLLYAGSIRHRDSRDNEGILTAGDVQWMTAGRGIIHSERASRDFRETGGILEGIQLWVNLPRVHKMTTPRYQHIPSDAFPIVKNQEGSARCRVVTGTYQGIQGPVSTFTPMLVLQLELDPGGETYLDIPEAYNAALYILDGSVVLNNNFPYTDHTLLHFRNDGAGISLKALHPTRALLIAGVPIDEPVTQWGPYVMNEQTEILEAMRDFQTGKMGFYID